YTANSVLSSFLPTNFAIQQEIIYKQANAGRYDDSRVIQLLKQLVEKDGNVYIDRERVGSILDEEQARRIKLLEGWVAIDNRKSTRLNSSHVKISYAVFCL